MTKPKPTDRHAADVAAAADAAWFRAHPDETVYFRAPIAGEFLPHVYVDLIAVEVRQIMPRLRVRIAHGTLVWPPEGAA
jgi:hypothetical protein